MREYDVLGESFFADPYPTLTELRRVDPCWYDPQLEAHIVTRYSDVARVLQDDGFSAQRVEQFARGAPSHLQDKVDVYVRQLGRWILFVDPPNHTALRSRLLRCFGQHFMPLIAAAAESAVTKALDEIAAQPAPDIVEHYAYPIPTNVLASILGISSDDIQRFKRWTTDIFTLVGAGVADEAAVEVGYRGITELRDYVLTLMEQKRRQPKDDVLSALAAPDHSDPSQQVDDEDVVGLFMSLIVAGHETSPNLIGNALHNIMSDQRCRNWVASRGVMTEEAVEELIRHDGPVFSMLRRAKQDIVVAGRLVREGEIVFSMLNAANRDPRKFSDPDRLDFDRPTPAHVGLGVGIHRCVGGAMARTVVREAVGRFLQRFPDATVAPGTRWQRNMSFRGLVTLPVHLHGVASA